MHHEFFADNPDSKNPLYNTKYGIYSPNCGFDNVLFSFGHDEYMYQVCVRNQCRIPPQGLAIIRYHSFYPWHKEGDYMYLMDKSDEEKLMWVKRFNECDLYSKSYTNLPDSKELRNYYENLIRKYFVNSELRL